MALKFKSGVRVGRGPAPQLLLALMVANEVYAEHGANCVITSLDDGQHRATSDHYQGRAADLRVKNLSEGQAGEIYDELYYRLTDSLGPEYLVLFESRGEPQAHIHLAYRGMSANR